MVRSGVATVVGAIGDDVADSGSDDGGGGEGCGAAVVVTVGVEVVGTCGDGSGVRVPRATDPVAPGTLVCKRHAKETTALHQHCSLHTLLIRDTHTCGDLSSRTRMPLG